MTNLSVRVRDGEVPLLIFTNGDHVREIGIPTSRLLDTDPDLIASLTDWVSREGWDVDPDWTTAAIRALQGWAAL